MRKLKSLLFLLTVFCITAFAQPSPIDMLQDTSNQMIKALQQNKTALKNNPEVVYTITKRILLPRVDTVGMARSVLGRNVWMNATQAQRQQFTQQFVTLLVRTYSAAFAAYTDENVQFSPIRGDTADQTFIQVDSQIIRHNGAPPVTVTYRLLSSNGEWKVYDFSVDGVSMIESFRSQFAEELSRGNLDTLIQQLVKHNSERQHFGS